MAQKGWTGVVATPSLPTMSCSICTPSPTMANRGVLLLLSDSTNADRPGHTESERAVQPRMEDFNRAQRRLMISCFRSSIHRIQLVLDLSAQFGRKVAIVGRSMTSVSEIVHSLGLLEIPDGVLIRPQDVMDTAPDKVTVLISGTQGEPMSALSRVAVDNHKHISVEEGDTVVLSARIIPGNEKGIFRMIDHMARRGADVLYGSMNPPVHVSGHASMEEMKLVLNLVRPRYFMPIHGEFRQLTKHAPWPSICAPRAWKRPSSWNRATCWKSTTTARGVPARSP
jgi:ribonuclease J